MTNRQFIKILERQLSSVPVEYVTQYTKSDKVNVERFTKEDIINYAKELIKNKMNKIKITEQDYNLYKDLKNANNNKWVTYFMNTYLKDDVSSGFVPLRVYLSDTEENVVEYQLCNRAEQERDDEVF